MVSSRLLYCALLDCARVCAHARARVMRVRRAGLCDGTQKPERDIPDRKPRTTSVVVDVCVTLYPTRSLFPETTRIVRSCDCAGDAFLIIQAQPICFSFAPILGEKILAFKLHLDLVQTSRRKVTMRTTPGPDPPSNSV